MASAEVLGGEPRRLLRQGGEGRAAERNTGYIYHSVIVHLFALCVLGPASPRCRFPESAGWARRHSGSSMRSCESPAISFDDRGIDWLSQSGPDAGLDFGVDRVSDYPGVWTELVHFLSVQLRAGRRFYVGGTRSQVVPP